jgi:hypothetical protein
MRAAVRGVVRRRDLAEWAMSWEPLRQLAGLPGPEWRLPLQRQDELCLVRAFEHFVETVYLVDSELVAVNRRPIAGRSVRAVEIENFAGSFQDAVAVLRHPPRWIQT